MRNGIGYNPHEECDKFIQCEFKNNQRLLRYHVKQCSFGTFWDQDKLTCNYAGKVACANDRCKKSGVKSYKTTGNCAQYYECVNGVSHVKRCPTGSSYSSHNNCVIDATCVSSGTGGITEHVCNYKARVNDPCHYDWVDGQRVHIMPCPPGTAYNPGLCRCDTASRTSCSVPATCKPIVDIDFNSAEPGEYDNYGAIIKNGHAYFDGHSNIKILRLANVDFRSKLTIKVSYKPKFPEDVSVTEAVVTNGDCGQDAPIVIANKGHETQFSLENQAKTFSKMSRESVSSWRDVVYQFNHGAFNGIVGTNKVSSAVHGQIMRSQCAFQLGHGTGFSDFRGWIDYITVSMC
ncbi:hypothetical protein SNE40_004039 [Patella caerulea]|uniref:Chitin-binding type-2 domain-containing protein n=1 Tax=Patella caerulea TaxID=87958 RepID=A0AAN8KJM3_PATCE